MDEDINTKENKDCNTVLYKLTAGSKADFNIVFNKFSILAKPKQNMSLINAKVLTRLPKIIRLVTWHTGFCSSLGFARFEHHNAQVGPTKNHKNRSVISQQPLNNNF